MNWSAEAITAATSDTEPSILVSFDDRKYLFNAGECTSRAWLQGPRRWKRTAAIFLTGVGSRQASGLPGLLMFLADGGINKVDLIGPNGTTHYLASMRTSLLRVGMELNASEEPSSVTEDAMPAPAYTDDLVSIWSVPIHAERPAGEGADEGLKHEECSSVPAKRKRTPSPDAPSKRPTSEPATLVEESKGDADEVEEGPKRVSSPASDPDEIYDSDPQLWRRLMVQNMFPFKAPELQSEVKALRKQEQWNAKARRAYGLVGMPIPPALKLKPAPLPPQFAPVRKKQLKRLPLFTHGPEGKPTLCYILVGPAVRGRFDSAKAKELGIPRGPERKRLTEGETVTFTVKDSAGNEIERTVKPEDCLGPPEIPRAMVLLDVPTPSHIPELVKSFTQHPFYSNFCSKAVAGDKSELLVHVVFHLCGKDVLEDERYKAFMRTFPENTHHVISSREHGNDPIVFSSTTYNQLRMNRLDPDMFPNLSCARDPLQDLSSIPDLPVRSHHLQKFSFVEMRPSREPCLDPLSKNWGHQGYTPGKDRDVWIPSYVQRAFVKAEDKIKDMGKFKRKPRPGDDVEIVSIGTSSSRPALYRNVSGTLVRIPGYGSVLLDAGEGSWGQLARLYGDDRQNTTTGVWEVLRDLRCIFVSHMHGDHHFGLQKILAMRKLLNPTPTQPLYVVGLRSHLLGLREISDLEDLGLDQVDGHGIVFIPADDLCRRPVYKNDSPEGLSVHCSPQDIANMHNALGLRSFATVEVPHHCKAYGVVLDHIDGWSIAYSGDCMPSKNLMKAARYATLLIHEATLADDQVEMAKEKAHSTFSQAIKVGDEMQAENILLTHFSARYPKVPPTAFLPSSPRAGASQSPNIGVAFDFQRFTIGDMWKLRFYLPAVEANLRDIARDDEEDIETSAWD